MDWIRLTKSGKDLTGLKGRLIEVTEEELKKHNKKDDCWICIRGKRHLLQVSETCLGFQTCDNLPYWIINNVVLTLDSIFPYIMFYILMQKTET